MSLWPNSSQKQLNGGGCIWLMMGTVGCMDGSESMNPGSGTSSRIRRQKQNKAISSRPTPSGLQQTASQHGITAGDQVFKHMNPWRHFTVNHNTQQNSSFSKLLLPDTNIATALSYQSCLPCICFPILLLSA